MLSWLGLAGAGLPLGAAQSAANPAQPAPPAPLRPRPLQFPRDHGSHNTQRTEWWYLTGHVATESGREFGFQVTFFRSRVDPTQAMKSRLAAKHLLFAHAAITDLQGQRLQHVQRIDRWNGEAPSPPPAPQTGPAGGVPSGASFASVEDCHIALRGWTLQRHTDGRYQTQIDTEAMAMALSARPQQALLLQGEAGFSRKGPEASQASFYVTEPQLAVSGQLRLGRERHTVSGRAWLDHEWSEALLHPDAVGWDWIGINLNNGDALTAFQLRRADTRPLWAGGSLRRTQQAQAPGGARAFANDEVQWTPLRWWTSPRTGARYPVQWRLRCPAGQFEVRARLDAQELDGSASTGTVYWEGLAELLDAQGQVVGSGYLELTGYAERIRL